LNDGRATTSSPHARRGLVGFSARSRVAERYVRATSRNLLGNDQSDALAAGDESDRVREVHGTSLATNAQH